MMGIVLQLRPITVYYIDFTNEKLTIEEHKGERLDLTEMRGDNWIAFRTKQEAQDFLGIKRQAMA